MHKLSNMCVCIPTIRPIYWERLKDIPEEVTIKVMWDMKHAPKKDTQRKNVEYYAHDIVPKTMKKIVPRKTAACVNYILWQAYKEDFEKVLMTHDDVIVPEGWAEEYNKILGSSMNMKHLISSEVCANPLDFFTKNKIYQRGFPHLSRYQDEYSVYRKQSKPIYAHMGLWSNYLDVDAIDKLNLGEQAFIQKKLPEKQFVVQDNFPFSNMNFGVMHDAIPFFAQIPMAQQVNTDYMIWRYDDVWAGLIAQNLLDLKDRAFSVGSPHVKHMKQGNLQKELIGEFYGQLLSPAFHSWILNARQDTLVNIKDMKDASFFEVYEKFIYNLSCKPREHLLFDKILQALTEWRVALEN